MINITNFSISDTDRFLINNNSVINDIVTMAVNYIIEINNYDEFDINYSKSKIVLDLSHDSIHCIICVGNQYIPYTESINEWYNIA